MNTIERMIEQHCRQIRKMLDLADDMPDEQLDALSTANEPFPWMDKKATLRQMLGKASAFAAPWIHAINGVETEYQPASIADMREALERSRVGFLEIVRSVEKDQTWDLTFVDSVCEPPEVFSYGGVIGHVLTFNAYRMIALIMEFKALGLGDLGFGDPIDLDRPA